MTSYAVLTGVLILSTTSFIGIIFAQTPCTDGWFGTNCEYQCHCANSDPCDKVDGSCSSGCDFYWFGPACQYFRARFSASNSLWWLTDINDGTCNSGFFTSVTVTLNTAIPLTWLRVVVNDAALLSQIQLSYRSHSSPPQNCTDLKTAKVDDVTLDIYCTTETTVKQVTLSGTGVAKLCSLYISRGRNVALKQTAQQSSRYKPNEAPNSYLAQNAVDGRNDAPFRADTRATCTHTTDVDSPDWWRVNFTNAVEIIWFQIYNRQDCCRDRLVGFTLTAQPESSSSGTRFTYTDPGRSDSDAKGDYIVVPANKISYPIGQVQVDVGTGRTMLVLCEVYVFGESPCPSNKFGLACERQCNCASGGRTCFIHSGGCPDGCAPNHTGEDCYDCVDGKYGPNCGVDCSIHCAGDKSCDKISGGCSEGCEPGYTGDQCLSECDANKWGQNCKNQCNMSCDNGCNHVIGDCICSAGYWGSTCQNEGASAASGQSSTNTWGIAVTVVLAVFVIAAVAVIALLLWRLKKISREKSHSNQRDVQAKSQAGLEYVKDKPQTSPQDVQKSRDNPRDVVETEYENPRDVEENEYENPRGVEKNEYENQRDVEKNGYHQYENPRDIIVDVNSVKMIAEENGYVLADPGLFRPTPSPRK